MEPDDSESIPSDGEELTAQERIMQSIGSLNQEQLTLAGEIIRLEQQKIHLANPKGIKQEIVDIVKRLIK